jgi:hypothetical protein
MIANIAPHTALPMTKDSQKLSCAKAITARFLVE